VASLLDPLLSPLAALLPDPLRELRREIDERLAEAPLGLNGFGYDPYGFSPSYARRFLLPVGALYRWYFRADAFGIARVPEGRVILVANHAGQFAYDGAMLFMAMLLEGRPPRVSRAMGEHFLFRVPWLGQAASRLGAMAGTPANCTAMLDAGECVMVFPEGARGANKPFRKRYQLQAFGTGFMRLALATAAPIVPVAIIGSEEQQPGFANLEGLGRRLGLPSFPVTVSTPWLGLAGPPFALPTKYRLHFGEPLRFEGDANEEDAAVEARVADVKAALSALIARGLEEREGVFR
jgi:1-acyl-sn-glycerol-3-phosphate acyltransferase